MFTPKCFQVLLFPIYNFRMEETIFRPTSQPVLKYTTLDKDSKRALRLNRSKYSKNVIFPYLDIISVRNKFDSVRVALVNYVDIFIATKTKINESFPTGQFAIDGFHKPLRCYRQKWGSISLCYVILTFTSVNIYSIA